MPPTNIRTYVRLICILFILSLFSTFSYGQAPSLTPNLPPAPEAAGLGQVTEVPIGEYTGSFNYGVPIHTLSYKGVSLPVSLSYQSGGARVSEEASLVGLGWNLNAGGLITRSLRGGDDFGRGVPQGGSGFTGYLHLVQTQQVPVDPLPGQNGNYINSGFSPANVSSTIEVSNCNPRYDCHLLNRVGTLDQTVCPVGKIDWESDLYTFNFGGYSGKFIIGKDGLPRVMDAQNLKIEYFLEDQGTNDHSWKITTPDGISYYFGTSQATRQNTYSGTVGYGSVDGGDLVPNSAGGFDNSSIVYTSAWYITRIELPNTEQDGINREVAALFHYADNGNSRVKPIPVLSASSWNGVNFKQVFVQACLPTLNTASESWNINVTEYDKVTLSSIRTPFDSISFVVSGREDLVNGDKLNAINIYKKSNGSWAPFTSFILASHYSSAVNNPLGQWEGVFLGSVTVEDRVTDDNMLKRLVLDGVTQVGTTGMTLEPYIFEYEDVQLPAKTSFAVDAYGFYNGKASNRTFLPWHAEYEILVYNSLGNFILSGADRRVDDAYAKAQHLRKVTAPLGGSITFESESNDYFIGEYVEDQFGGSKSFGLNGTPPEKGCYTSLTQTNANTSFTIDNGRTDVDPMIMLSLEFTSDGNNCPRQGCPSECMSLYGFDINLYDESTGLLVETFDSDIAGLIPGGNNGNTGFIGHSGQECFTLPNGTYSIEIVSQLPNLPNDLAQDFISLGIDFSWPTYSYVENELAGGLRVASSTYCPVEGEEIYYEYAYTDEEGKSTGIELGRPELSIYSTVPVQLSYDCSQNATPDFHASNWEVSYIERSSQSYTALSTDMFGQFTAYSKVTKMFGGEDGNGSSVSFYKNEPLDLIGGPNGQLAKENGFAGFWSQTNGRLELQETFSKSGTKVQETSFVYDASSKIRNSVYFFRPVIKTNDRLGFLVAGPGSSVSNAGNNEGHCLDYVPALIAYQDVPEWNQLLSTTTKTYDLNGQNFSSSGQNQTYDQDNFNLKTQTVWGPGGSKTTEYFYPSDVTGLARQLDTTYHMTGVPVRINNPDGTKTIVIYDYDRLVPKRVNIKYTDNTTIAQARITAFTPDNLPEKVKVHGFDDPQIFEWNDDQQLLSKTFLNHKQSYTYNDARQVATMKGIDGQVVSYTYDGLNRLETITARDGDVTATFSYLVGGGDNSTTKTTTFADAEPITETNYFDGMGRPVSTVVNNVEKSHQSYDAYGRVAQQLYLPGYGNTQMTYEASPLSRVLETTYPDGSKILTDYTVEDDFPTVLITDEIGNISKSQTDVFGRIRKQVDAQGGATVYAYTDFDAPLQIQPPSGSPYIYTYYDRGNLLASKTIPDGGTTTYHYDDGHRLLATELPNASTIRIAYDAYGRERATSKQGTYAPWGATLSSLPSPLTTTNYQNDNIQTPGTGTVVSSEAALLMPDGTQGSMVTTSYTKYDDFARLTDYNDQYSIDGQTRTDNYVLTLNHRDLATKSVQTGFGGTLTQGSSFDNFSRPTSADALLEYGNASDPDDRRALMNVAMKYNTADQLIERRLLQATRGFYGETLKYDHPRGWLTAINRPSSRSFDAFMCEEPVGDVYAPEPVTDTTDLLTIFNAQADGSYVSIPDLECDDITPDTVGCIIPIKDYLVSIPNPIKFRKGEFANAASVPCPVGNSCSSAARVGNLEDVIGISITGVTVDSGGGAPASLVLGAPYILDDMLLSNQIQGINHPELDRFKREVIYAAATNDWFIRDVDFSIDSDASNCTKCTANGNKSYNIDVTFSESAIKILSIDVDFVYTTFSTLDSTNFQWHLPTSDNDPKDILGPCDPKPNDDDKPVLPGGHSTLADTEEPTNETSSPSVFLEVSGQSRKPFSQGAAAGAREVNRSKASNLRFSQRAISATDSLRLLTAIEEGCTSFDPIKEEEAISGQKSAAASTTGEIAVFNRVLQINSFFGRKLPPRKATTINLPGAPYQIHQGTLSEAEQAANGTESARLEKELNAWLRSNGFRQSAKLSINDSGELRLTLDHGPLELIYANISQRYARPLACPNSSGTEQQIEGVRERVFAFHTPGWIDNHHPRVANTKHPANRRTKPGTSPSNNSSHSLNKDNGTPLCPDQPDPVCTPAEQQAQLDQVAGFFVAVDSTFIADFVGSTTLYAVELCDGSIAYLLQDQVDALTGDYNILGQLPLASIDQGIVATLGIGPNPLFSMNLDYYANGNIKTTRWKTTYHAPNVYSYKYDKLNRLEEALYNPSSAGPGVGAQDIFSVSGITYDGIGNIMTLNRQGVTQCGGPGGAELVVNAIDQLAYSYANGSRLSEVVDNATHPDLKDLGVKNGGGTYQYDAAGRMTHDNHRGLVIEYNHLDLPRRITDQNNVVTEITYDATGRKWLQQTATDARIYAGSVVLTKENGTYSLEAANTSDGRLVYDAEAVEVYPEFYHKDHLGNVRVAFADRNKDLKIELLGPTSEITQQNDYYPFGLRQEGDSLVFHGELSGSRYRYNGIEHMEELGLDMAFYRSYDAAIGRWLQVDPAAESFTSMSPYTGMGNNPILISDPLGDSIPTTFYAANGNVLSTVPNVVQQMFNQEYGVTVAYNAGTSMLYQSGDAKTSNTVSPPGRATVTAALGEKNTGTNLVFGYDLHVTGYSNDHENAAVAFGLNVGYLNEGEKSIALVDLADFNPDGSLKYHTPSSDLFNLRSMNMARVFEHEFFGHGEKSIGGFPFMESSINVPYINSTFRSPAGIPTRVKYTFSFSNGSSLNKNSSTIKQAVKKRKRIRYDKF